MIAFWAVPNVKSCVFLAPNPTPTCDSHLINLFGLGWDCFHLDFPCGSNGKASAYNVGDPGSIPGWGRSPGEGNGNHSSILAWKIQWMEEPGWLLSMGSQRVGHD